MIIHRAVVLAVPLCLGVSAAFGGDYADKVRMERQSQREGEAMRAARGYDATAGRTDILRLRDDGYVFSTESGPRRNDPQKEPVGDR